MKTNTGSFLLFTILTAVLVSVTILSCKKSASGTNTPTAPTVNSTKAPIVGLVTQGSAKSTDSTWIPDNSFPEANSHTEVYSAVVIRAVWKQLEPQRSSFEFSAIDAALNNIKTYNVLHPAKPMTGKLRIFCGINAPLWVKALAGGPVSVYDASSGVTIQVGRFWTPAYRQAWQELQAALAARYDGNALLQEVAVSSCATLTAEPFIQPFNQTTIPVLHAAGFTDSAFKAALTGALDDYAPWKFTAIDYTFNPFRATNSGQPVIDSNFAALLMQSFRARYGSRAVIANHGLQSPATTEQTLFYTPFLSLGKPIEFQTYSPGVDWNATIALGFTYHPTEIEVWDTQAVGGYANVSLSQLQSWASMVGH